LANVSAKNGRNLQKPYSSWVLACCQFQDSVEWTVDSYTITGWLLELNTSSVHRLVYNVPHESKKLYI